MSTIFQHRATLDDLLRVEGKAELVAGRIIHSMPSGDVPSLVAFEIAVRLREFARSTVTGRAYADGIGFALPAPLPGSGRESFSPDAAYYTGPRPLNPMRFIEGVPDFAVEVRSENDYGPKAEREMADRRADYFAAGTLAVWDVDPEAETIALYTPTDPASSLTFRRVDVAHAEPAVPGWRLSVGDLFDAAAN